MKSRKRLRTALIGAVMCGVLTLSACDLSAGAQSQAPSAAQDAINFYFGDIADQATRVAQCESTMNPEAVSSGGGNWGLFQINTVHRDDFEAVTGRSWNDVLDPYANTAYAVHLYNVSGGWGPWGCRRAA
ncbi:MAG: hypothetical protein QOJ67_2289 [Acidimicrobiaceae bacterium]